MSEIWIMLTTCLTWIMLVHDHPMLIKAFDTFVTFFSNLGSITTTPISGTVLLWDLVATATTSLLK